jgi:hypothetical protein
VAVEALAWVERVFDRTSINEGPWHENDDRKNPYIREPNFRDARLLGLGIKERGCNSWLDLKLERILISPSPLRHFRYGSQEASMTQSDKNPSKQTYSLHPCSLQSSCSSAPSSDHHVSALVLSSLSIDASQATINRHSQPSHHVRAQHALAPPRPPCRKVWKSTIRSL